MTPSKERAIIAVLARSLSHEPGSGFKYRDDPRYFPTSNPTQDAQMKLRAGCHCGWRGTVGDEVCYVSDREFEEKPHVSPSIIGCCPECDSWDGVVEEWFGDEEEFAEERANFEEFWNDVPTQEDQT